VNEERDFFMDDENPNECPGCGRGEIYTVQTRMGVRRICEFKCGWYGDVADEERNAQVHPVFRSVVNSMGVRHPGDFNGRPSDSQMEYFKRGGR